MTMTTTTTTMMIGRRHHLAFSRRRILGQLAITPSYLLILKILLSLLNIFYFDHNLHVCTCLRYDSPSF